MYFMVSAIRLIGSNRINISLLNSQIHFGHTLSPCRAHIRQAKKHQAISRSCVLANAMTVERRNAISRCQWQNGVKYLGSNPGICEAIKMLLQSQLKQSCLCLAASNLYAQAYSFTLAPALCLHANLCPFSCFIFVTLDFRSLALTI